jgi:hypothetical protein
VEYSADIITTDSRHFGKYSWGGSQQGCLWYPLREQKAHEVRILTTKKLLDLLTKTNRVAAIPEVSTKEHVLELLSHRVNAATSRRLRLIPQYEDRLTVASLRRHEDRIASMYENHKWYDSVKRTHFHLALLDVYIEKGLVSDAQLSQFDEDL